MAILFIIVGLIYALMPRFAWNVEVKWKSLSKEPSKKAIVINRIIGIILFLIGIYSALR